MSQVFLISKNTFKELVRNRVLYSFLMFAVFLVMLTVAVGQLSYTEQLRLTMSLGLASIHFCIMGLTIFLGGSLIYKEIERLTILTLLSRPISRTQFLIGKYLGFLTLLIFFSTGFYMVFAINLYMLGFEFSVINLLVSFVGIMLESLVLLAITTFFSTFCASFLTILFSIGIFLIGHWSISIVPPSETEGKTIFYYIVHFAKSILPNLEHFNWRLNALEPFVTSSHILNGIGISGLWVVIFLAMAILIFRNKDFA